MWCGARSRNCRAVVIARSSSRLACCAARRARGRVGVDMLGQLGVRFGQTNRAFHEETMALLLALLDHEQDPSVLSSIAIALGHRQDPREIAPLRFGVVLGVSRYEDEQAIQTLIHLSTDADAEVRDWATFGLISQIEVDTPAIRAALFARLSDEDADTRGEAMVGLAHRHNVRVVDPLLHDLEAGDAGSLLLEAAAESGIRASIRRCCGCARHGRAIQRTGATGNWKRLLPVAGQCSELDMMIVSARHVSIMSGRKMHPTLAARRGCPWQTSDHSGSFRISSCQHVSMTDHPAWRLLQAQHLAHCGSDQRIEISPASQFQTVVRQAQSAGSVGGDEREGCLDLAGCSHVSCMAEVGKDFLLVIASKGREGVILPPPIRRINLYRLTTRSVGMLVIDTVSTFSQWHVPKLLR